jgi:RNA polymerase sigma-70 factor, ECF subfamily
MAMQNSRLHPGYSHGRENVRPFLQDGNRHQKKQSEQFEKEPNIQMEAPRQTVPAGLGCDLPLPAPPGAQTGTGEIETEVMALFEQYRDPLLRYALSFGVPVPDAEEIVQDVFLSLFRHLQLGRPRGNLCGWIFRVAHNLTLKRRHANKRLWAAAMEEAGTAAQRADPGPNPEDACTEAQRQQRLLSVVRALPDMDQSCLRMRAEGLRYREIAGALGISLGTVSMSLARSLGKLIRADRG